MNRTTRCPGSRRHSAGFTLLEGLIAMAVMAFGILALVSLQSAFSSTSEESKLRTEATRLAQQKLDDFRAFELLNTTAGKLAYADIVSSATAETINVGTYSNATFARSWTVTPSDATVATPPYRMVAVTVTWNDRRGAQSLTLSSVIGSAEPAQIHMLGVGPGKTVTRQPKDRNINVPYPARSIAGNRSAFDVPATSPKVTIVFDNLTGQVLGKCTDVNDDALVAVLDPGTGPDHGCDQTRGYLLSGYVRFCTSNGCSAQNQAGDAQAQFARASDTTLPLDLATPLQVDITNQSGGSPSMTCYSSRQVALKAGGTVADTGQPANDVEDRFIAYVCIVYPVDHDSDTTTAPTWWGRVTVNPSGWVIGSSSGQYKVCRFTGDYNLNGAVSNSEHPLWYRSVTGALDSQNYLVIPQNDNCPNDKPMDAVNGDFIPANTVLHQASGSTDPGIAWRSYQCGTIACSGGAKSYIEPSDTAAFVKME